MRGRSLAALVLPRPPERSDAEWHVSPAIDTAVYHYGWLFVLVPLLFHGSRYPDDYLWILFVTLTANFAHQALTLPIVYLDREVFARERLRFTIVPLVLLAAFVASVFLLRFDRGTLLRIFGAVTAAAFAWNSWHVYMQKFGIFRLYDAKASAAGGGSVPRWVDRLLVFGWLPLFFAVLGPANGEVAVASYPQLRGWVDPLVAVLARLAPLLVPAAVAFLVASLGVFLVAEWRVRRLRSLPRLSMFAGMTGLSASLLLVDPVKAVIAFGFAHALEYIVFVWAWGRRRYRRPLSHRPWIGTVMRRPALAIGAFVLGVGIPYLLIDGWGTLVFRDSPHPRIGGVRMNGILVLLAMYLSMAHFWLDAFLWKMRRPEVRAML